MILVQPASHRYQILFMVWKHEDQDFYCILEFFNKILGLNVKLVWLIVFLIWMFFCCQIWSKIFDFLQSLISFSLIETLRLFSAKNFWKKSILYIKKGSFLKKPCHSAYVNITVNYPCHQCNFCLTYFHDFLQPQRDIHLKQFKIWFFGISMTEVLVKPVNTKVRINNYSSSSKVMSTNLQQNQIG